VQNPSLNSLKRVDPRDSGKPAFLAFLAMAQQRLGHKEQAQATIAGLRKIVQQPEWIKDEEAQGFLREAEILLGGTPAMVKE